MKFKEFLAERFSEEKPERSFALDEWKNSQEINDNGPFHFFWKGCLSQWYPSEYEIEDIQYGCAEQYMMSQKALVFGDNEAYRKIMETRSPAEQKRLGRRVENFDSRIWDEVCKEIVKKANLAKFRQNKPLAKVLIQTDGKALVEASPYDKIWGIGLSESDSRIKSRATWLGKNWLGLTLDEVRDEIILDEFMED